MFNFANKMLNALVGNEEGGPSSARPQGPQGIHRPQGQGSWMAAPGTTGQMAGSRMPGQNIPGFGNTGMSSLPGSSNMQGGSMGQPGMGNASMPPNMGGPGSSGPGMNQPGMNQQGMNQPGMNQPGMNQPGINQPGMNQPGMNQPGMGGPSQGMGGPAMSGPGMGGPAMSGQGMGGTGITGQGVGGQGMGGPGMSGPGMGGPGMSAPGMTGPGGMNRPPNMMGPRPPQHGHMSPMGRGGPPRPGMGPGMRGMPPGGPRGPGGPGMMPGIMPRPGMGPMGPRGPMSMNGHTPRPIRPGIPGQGPQMTPGGMMMGPRPTIVEPTSSTSGGQFGPKLQQDHLHRPILQQDIKPSPQPQGKNPNVDLSEMTAEERAIIENVMAKAQQLDGSGMPKTSHDPNKDLQNTMMPTKCVLCHVHDSILGQNCIDCYASVCKNCIEMMPAIENKRQGLVCVNCANHRKSIVSNVQQINQTVPNYQLNQSQSPYNQQKQQSQQGYPMNTQQQNSMHSQQQGQQQPHNQQMQGQQMQNQQMQNQQMQNQLAQNQQQQNQPLQNQSLQNQQLQAQQQQNQQLQNKQNPLIQGQQLQNQQPQNPNLQNQQLQNQQIQQLQGQQLQNQSNQNMQNQPNQRLHNQQGQNLQSQQLQSQQGQYMQDQNQHFPNQQMQNQHISDQQMQGGTLQQHSTNQQAGKDTKYGSLQNQSNQIASQNSHQDRRDTIDDHGNFSQRANLDNSGQYKSSSDYRRGQLRSQNSIEPSYTDHNAPGMFRGPADGQDNKVISQAHGMPTNQAQQSQFQMKQQNVQSNQNMYTSSPSIQPSLPNQGPPPVYANNSMQNTAPQLQGNSNPASQNSYGQQGNLDPGYQLQQGKNSQDNFQSQNYNRYPDNSQNTCQLDGFGTNTHLNNMTKDGMAVQKVTGYQKGTNEPQNDRLQNFPTAQRQDQSNQYQNYGNKQYQDDGRNAMQSKQDPMGPMNLSDQQTYAMNQADPYYQGSKTGQQNPGQPSNLASQHNYLQRADGSRADKSQQNTTAPFGGITNFLGIQKSKTESDDAAYRQQQQSQLSNDQHGTVGQGHQNNLSQINMPQSTNQRQGDPYQNMHPLHDQGMLPQKGQTNLNTQQQNYPGSQQQIHPQQAMDQQMNIQPHQQRSTQHTNTQQLNPHTMSNTSSQQPINYQDPHIFQDPQQQVSQFGTQQTALNQKPGHPVSYQTMDGSATSFNPSTHPNAAQQTGSMHTHQNQTYNVANLQQANLAVQHGQQQIRSMPLSPTDPKQMLAAAGMTNRIRQTSPMAYRKSRGGLRPDVGETWPGSVHLSPIMDVSPSIEMAEQANQGLKQDSRVYTNQPIQSNQHITHANQQPKSSISGMLSDFTKALGLSGTSPKDENKLLIDHLGTGLQQPMGPGMHQTMGTVQQQPVGMGMQQGTTVGTQQAMGSNMQNHMGTSIHHSKNQQRLMSASRGQENLSANQNFISQNLAQPHSVLAAQNQTIFQQAHHDPHSSEHHSILNANYALSNQLIGGKSTDVTSIPIQAQVISTTMVNQAGQPVVVQQLAPAQAMQLQQPKVHIQQQPNMKAFKNKEQANSMLQQQALMHQIQQEKLMQQTSRKDMLTGAIGGVQQTIGNKLGIYPAAIPTAALLSQSTLAASDVKQRSGHVSESPLASLQRLFSPRHSTLSQIRSQIARQASLDGTSTGSYSSGVLGNTRSSSSMTNLNIISKATDIILPTRPGSALGLLRSKTGSTGGYTTGGPQLKTGLPTCIASLLPPDLHHLIYTNTNTFSSTEALLTAKLREELKSSGSDSRRALLEAELHKIQEERRRNTVEKERERDIKLRCELDKLSSINYAGPLSMKQRNVVQRRLGMPNSAISPLAASPKLRRRGHHRQMSDPRLFSSIDNALRETDRHYSSNEYLRSHWDPSVRHSKSSYLEEEDVIMARQAGYHSSIRRSSDCGAATDYWDRCLTPTSLYEYSMGGYGKHKIGRKTRKPRSWHPSPYASDDDDDMYSREEKKQKIKAEIARRRQQIEENARLHEELLRLARLRENAEHGYYDVRTINFDHSPTPSAKDSTSVLRSIDEILRDVRDPSTGYYGHSNYKQRSPTSKYAGSITGHGSMPMAGHGSMPMAGHGSMPMTGHGTMPMTGHGTMPMTGHGTMPITGHGPMPMSGHGPMSMTGHGPMPMTGHGTMAGHGPMNIAGHGPMPMTGHGTMTGHGPMTGHRPNPRHYYGPQGQSPRYPLTEEDKSIARLASTFQAGEFGEYAAANYGRITDLSPLTVDSMNDYTPAMPLLPDMPTRSRKLLEDLGSSPIATQNQRDATYHHQRATQELIANARRELAISPMRTTLTGGPNTRYYSSSSRRIERGTSLEQLNTSRPLHYYSHDHLDGENYANHRRWSEDYTYGGDRYSNATWNNPGAFNYNDKYDDGYGMALNSPLKSRKTFNVYNEREDTSRLPYDQERRLPYSSGHNLRDSRHDYYDGYDHTRNGYYSTDVRGQHSDRRASTNNPNLRRICLTRDPKDKKVSGNGLGMKVIGGKEIPNSHGRLGAYIAKITLGGVVDTIGDFKEGDLIVEWNGISLLDKTHEETQKVLNQTADEVEVEIGIRSDVNMLRSSSNNKSNNNSRRSSMHSKQFDDGDLSKSRDRSDRSEKSHRGRAPLEDKTIVSNVDYNANENSKYAGTSAQMNSYLKDRDISDDYYRDRQRSHSDKENYPRRDRFNSYEDDHQVNYSDHRENGYSKDQEYARSERGERRRRRRRSFEKDSRQKSFDRNQSADSRHLGGNLMDDHIDGYSMGNDVRRYDAYDKGDPHRLGEVNDRLSGLQNHYYDDDPRGFSDESRRHLDGDSHSIRDEYKSSGAISSGKEKKSSRSQSEPREHSGSTHRSHHQSHSGRQKSRKSHHKSSSKSDHNQTPLGMIELQICYDTTAKILYVTVLRAKGLLTLRDDGGTQPDPFVKVYLLPGRSIENQRRTRFFSNTSTPEWNQTMVYPNLQAADFKKRYLEVTAWNYANNKPNEFLGETVLDLSDPSVVNEEPKWYQLQEMVEPDGSQMGTGNH